MFPSGLQGEPSGHTLDFAVRALLFLPAILLAGSPTPPDAERQAREAMVREQLEARDIRDRAVLAAFRALPRHPFVPAEHRALAHVDRPLPIGQGQTISQPYVVALMLQALDLRPDHRVLEVGSGSGYVLGLLDRMGCRAFGIELEASLCETSRRTLSAVEARQVQVRCGDGFAGWPEEAPFDAVILSCAVPEIPEPLWRQLKVGGRLVAPVGTGEQELVLVRRTARGREEQRISAVRFVPMRRSAPQH